MQLLERLDPDERELYDCTPQIAGRCISLTTSAFGYAINAENRAHRVLIAEHWNDLLRLVASMKFGHTTARLLIAKLHAGSRQGSLAKALRHLLVRHQRRTPP